MAPHEIHMFHHVPTCLPFFMVKSPINPHMTWFFSHVDPLQTTHDSHGEDARPALSAKQRALQSLLEMKRSGELQLLAEAGDHMARGW